MPPGVCNKILNSGMLHDVVLNKHKEPKMRELPISTMDPVSILFADVVGFTEMSATVSSSNTAAGLNWELILGIPKSVIVSW